MQNIEISLLELLSLIGLIQTVYAIVYLSFRAGDFKRAIYPLIFFATLLLAFISNFILPDVLDIKSLLFVKEFSWIIIPIISVILIVQIAKIESIPSLGYQLLLFFLIPLGLSILLWPEFSLVFSIIGGTISLLTLWASKDVIGGLLAHKVSGRERYWLIMTVIFMNVILIALMYASLSKSVDLEEYTLIQAVLGLALVYLVSTTMFRIYPQAIQLVDRHILKLSRANETVEISNPELVAKLRDVIEIQKLYQESSFSRTDLAREMGLSETVTSKLLNDVYGKSLPQLVNERRITEACDLLYQTDQNITIIAEQVGFNSIASFNRVFKDIKGESPTEFRRKIQNK
jgi:AraC-like DNA-binding protein